MKKIIQKIGIFILCINVLIVSYAGEIIKIPLRSTYVTLEPYKLQDISSLWVSRQINCQLVRMHGRVPVLEAARSMRYASPLILKIKLKQDILFSNGSQLTAQDVIATFDYLRNKEAEFRNIFDWTQSIKAIGKFDIIIKLKKQTPDFITALSAPHYAIFEKNFIEKAIMNPVLWKNPIGCGGYQVYENNKDNVVLIPNKKGPSIIFSFEPKKQISMKEVKKYDLILAMQIVGNPKKVEDFHTTQVFDPYQFYFDFNTRLPIWQNKKNRCSVFSKLNAEKILKEYGNKAKISDNLIPSGILGYSSNKNYLSDIIKEYVNIPAPEKADFCISLVATSVEKNYRTEYLNMVKKIYPNAKLKIIKSCSNMNQVIEQQKCDGVLLAVKSNYLDAYEYLQELSTPKGINPTGYYDPDLVAAINDSQMKLTVEKKAKEYRKIINQIDSLCLMYPLFTISYDIVFVNNDIITPGLGQDPINEYYLGNISYKKESMSKTKSNTQ